MQQRVAQLRFEYWDTETCRLVSIHWNLTFSHFCHKQLNLVVASLKTSHFPFLKI